MVLAVGAGPVRAQGNELAALRAEIAKQQVIIAQLLKRIEALEKQQPPAGATTEDLRADVQAQEDSINSLREIVNSRVNLNGYYNFRFFADGSEESSAFQQHHLGVLMAKQLGKFNFLMELELQNVPHHPEIAPAAKTRRNRGARAAIEGDISGEGRSPSRTRDGIHHSRSRCVWASCLRSTGGRTTT
jgi:hypothetical protein